MKFPMPNDIIYDQGIVVASTWYREDLHLATILVLRPAAPFFRVGVWNFKDLKWDGDYYVDHFNVVPAIEGEGSHPDKNSLGYTDLGGDY